MAFKCLTSRVPEYLSSQFTKREEISSKGGPVVRALGSQQCSPGSNPGVEAISGLNLLLVLSLAPRGFSPITLVFPSPQKPTLSNSNSIWNTRTRLNEFVRTPIKCFMGRQITIQNFLQQAGVLNTIPFFKTDSGQKTFYYRIVSFWNSMESCLLKLSSQYLPLSSI